MEINQATLKAQVMAEMERRLERKLERLKGKAELDLREIEDLAIEMEHEMGQVLTQALVESQGEKGHAVTCPDCQQPMTYKGKKVRHLRTRSGEVQAARPYYYCSHCHSGHFPPG
jgi:Mn-dependent DtxR family transcriptional regulator